jgi:type II secretory ATPase GspE/PulE/Tfp pilus assembly ATPase PilB-like protein
LVIDNDIREKIITGGSEAQIRAMERQKGYNGLLESGMSNMLKGLTTAEEVLSVTFTEDVKA